MVKERSIPEILAERDATRKQGPWIPGCNGTETWAQNGQGKEGLYVYQPSTGRHGWLGRDDIVYQDLQQTIMMD